jgi:hypothetical protein
MLHSWDLRKPRPRRNALGPELLAGLSVQVGERGRFVRSPQLGV